MKVRFLLDENLPPRLGVAVKRLNLNIDILRVGDPGTPILGTLDPDVLHYLELSQRLLVTDNRKSMPEHLAAHWAGGGHIWGLFWVRPQTPSLAVSARTGADLGNIRGRRVDRCGGLDSLLAAASECSRALPA